MMPKKCEKRTIKSRAFKVDNKECIHGPGMANLVQAWLYVNKHFREGTIEQKSIMKKYDYVNKAKNTLHCMQEGVQDRTFVGLNFNSKMTRADK
jgi:hypothetical protein